MLPSQVDGNCRLATHKNPTPRTIKAFINQLRYLTSRDSSQGGSGHEAQLLALATIYYCYEKNIEEIMGMMEIYFAEENRPSHCKFEER